jgi:hypothetical protein
MIIGCSVPNMAAPSLVDPFGPDVTVVLDVRGHFPPGAMRQMRQEAGQILSPSGIRLEWRTLSEASAGTFKDLVVLTFHGSCALDAAPAFLSEPGAYAFTRSADGEVQPFGEVDCDRVVNSVKSASTGEDRSNPDLLMGRALGRVVAHELVHMLTRSADHGREGVQKAALSGRQLISASLPLSALDIDRLKERYMSRVSRGSDTPAESETR